MMSVSLRVFLTLACVVPLGACPTSSCQNESSPAAESGTSPGGVRTPAPLTGTMPAPDGSAAHPAGTHDNPALTSTGESSGSQDVFEPEFAEFSFARSLVGTVWRMDGATRQYSLHFAEGLLREMEMEFPAQLVAVDYSERHPECAPGIACVISILGGGDFSVRHFHYEEATGILSEVECRVRASGASADEWAAERARTEAAYEGRVIWQDNHSVCWHFPDQKNYRRIRTAWNDWVLLPGTEPPTEEEMNAFSAQPPGGAPPPPPPGHDGSVPPPPAGHAGAVPPPG